MISKERAEMLMSREKLMEEISQIMHENFDPIENRDGVIKELCDAVCEHFPAE